MAMKERVQQYRSRLRAKGLRPIQIWVPDTRKETFAVECKRQSKLADAADAKNKSLDNLMDGALQGIEGWE